MTSDSTTHKESRVATLRHERLLRKNCWWGKFIAVPLPPCCPHALLIHSFEAINHCSVFCSWLICLILAAQTAVHWNICGPVHQKGLSLSALSLFSRCESHLLNVISEKTQNRTIMSRLRGKDSGRLMVRWRGGWGWRGNAGGVMPKDYS